MAHDASRLRTVVHVLIYLAACPLVLAFAARVAAAQQGPLQALVIGFIGATCTMGLTVLFVRWDGLPLRDVGAMPGSKSPFLLAVGFAAGLLLVALHSFLVGLSGHVHWVRAASPTAFQAGIVVTGYLLLASREELAFHGYPLRRLQMLFGVWGAQAAIATVFALEHMAGGWSPWQALWGAAMGSLLFGMASIATRGLAVPIGMHAAWNIGDWMRGNRPEPGYWSPQVDPAFKGSASLTGVWCYVAVMLLAILCFWWWHRIQERTAARGC